MVRPPMSQSQLDALLYEMNRDKLIQMQQAPPPQQVAGSGPMQQVAGLAGEATGAYGLDGLLAAGGPSELMGPPTAAELMGPSAAGAAPGIFSLSGIGGAGNVLLPAAGAIGAYDVLSHDMGPGRGALEGAASGAAIGSYFGMPWLGAGVGGVVGLGKGLMEHESTRDAAKRHTKSLLDQHLDDPAYQAYVKGMREQFNSGPPDPSHPFGDTKGNKYSTFEEYKNAGLDPANLTGVYGNIKTFGNDWTKLNYDQQKAVTQGLIDKNLYKSKKGEVEITDAAKAKEVYQSELDKLLKEHK